MIDRREFFAIPLGAAFPARLAAAASTPETQIAGAPIQPEDDARLRSIPTKAAIEGRRYRTSAPDTLDLADRMALSVNALTNAWMPSEHWALLFGVDFSRRPAELTANHATDAWLNIPAKFIEALVACRAASGTDLNLPVDRKVIATQLGLIGADGLSYAPSDALQKLGGERNYSEIWGEGRLLLALAMLAQVDSDPRWIEAGKRKVDRLLELSRKKDDFRFLWKGKFFPGENPPPNADEPSTKREKGGSLADRDPVFSMIYSTGALGNGAGLFYRVTKYEPALELCGGLAKWARARMFHNEDGRYSFFHFHHSLFSLMTLAHYAEAASDRDMYQRVNAVYRWVRQIGDPMVGWYSEVMPGSEMFERRTWESVETCEVSDMIYLALYLTRAGIGDYWDDVDRWTRNMFTEAQYTDPAVIDRLPPALLREGRSQAAYMDDRDIVPRMAGSFFGWMQANDGLLVLRDDDGVRRLYRRAFMHCCTGNGSRVLFHIWDSIVTGTPERTRVNLLLNRASELLDVDSYLPAAGRVVVKTKTARNIGVRMPEWVDVRRVAATMGGKPLPVTWDGRYAQVAGLKPGDEVALEFPVPERTLYRVIGRGAYKVALRGSNVVGLDPPGEAYPFYRNQPAGRLVEKERFVYPKRLVW